eukprot:s4873_g1.t5
MLPRKRCHANVATQMLPRKCCHTNVATQMLPRKCCHANVATQMLPRKCCHAVLNVATQMLPRKCCLENDVARAAGLCSSKSKLQGRGESSAEFLRIGRNMASKEGAGPEEADVIADLPPEDKEETEAEKTQRKAKERKEGLKELFGQIFPLVVLFDVGLRVEKGVQRPANTGPTSWGGSASVAKLLSLATWTDFLILAVGFLGALAHGAGQPLMCLMFGDLIDGLGSTMFAEVDTTAFVNMSAADQASMMEAMSQQANELMLESVGDTAIKFILIGCGVCAAASLQGFSFAYFVDSQVKKMRPMYFDAMLHQDVGWFDTHSPGALAGEMTADLEAFHEAFGTKLGVSIMSSSGLITGLAVGFFLSWEIALLMLATLPLMSAGALIMAQAVLDAVQEVQGPYEKAAALADEMLFAIRTVVAFGGEAREIRRYSDAVSSASKGGLRNRIKIGFGMGYIWFVYFAAMAVAFWFAMTLMTGGKEGLSSGRVMAAFTCVLTSGFMIGNIAPGFANIAAAKVSMARFFCLVNSESTIQKRVRDDREVIGPIETLQLEDVHFAYPARPEITVLHGLSLTIQKGKKVAVVGESGSGNCRKFVGKVLVNGKDLRNINIQSYRKQIGYVGQEPVLFATSVRENILQGSSGASEEDFEAAAKQAQLDFVRGLPKAFDTYVGSGGSQFSGGQKQRIAIARALLKKPSLLFLDEATSALDSRSEKMIQRTIDSLGKTTAGKMTIVSIAHRLSTVQNSDIIFVLSGGRVAEKGSHSELTAQEGGIYQALAAAQGAVLVHQDTGDLNLEDVEEEVMVPKIMAEPSKAANTMAEEAEDKEANRIKDITKNYKVPMRRLLSFSRPYWWAFAPGFLAAVVSGACFPVLGAFILVEAMMALMQTDMDVMKRQAELAAMWFLIFGAAKCVSSCLQFASFGIIAEATTKEARVALLTNMFRQDVGFHDDPENTSAKLVASLKIYAFRIARLIITFGDKADALCSVVVGLTLAFIACWEMAGVMLLSIPIFGAAQGIQMAMMMGGEKSENQVFKAATQVLADSLLNSRTVQASGNERDICKLYTKMVDSISQNLARRHLLNGLVFGSSAFLGLEAFWIMAGGFYFMGVLIDAGRATFETGQQAFMGILYAGMGAGMASALTGDLAKAKVAAHAPRKPGGSLGLMI